MIVEKRHGTFGHWGYEPAVRAAPGRARLAARETARLIRAAGHEVAAYGLELTTARARAAATEAATGVEMRVFSHDYL